jgi:hypothetical protein
LIKINLIRRDHLELITKNFAYFYERTAGQAMTTWFVDEAGDPTLFGRFGKHNVGVEGCSRFFILGKLECTDLLALETDLVTLRLRLMGEPYLTNISSMQAARGKTAKFFHAKNDAPEVRYEVYRLLAKHPLRFIAAVCDKSALLSNVLEKQNADKNYRYDGKGHALYDALTRQLFARWHGQTDQPSSVMFAQRGAKPRTQAFASAIKQAEETFEQTISSSNPTIHSVTCAHSHEQLGLQAVDYYLWAVQRFYERGEERYLQFIWPQVIEIIDLNLVNTQAKRTEQVNQEVRPSAGIYNQKNPLTIESRAGIVKV